MNRGGGIRLGLVLEEVPDSHRVVAAAARFDAEQDAVRVDGAL